MLDLCQVPGYSLSMVKMNKKSLFAGALLTATLLLADSFGIPMTSGSSKALGVSAEGNVVVEWDENEIEISWQSVDQDSVVTVKVDGDQVNKGDSQGLTVVDRSGADDQFVEVEWERALSATEIAALDVSVGTRALLEKEPDLFVKTAVIGVPISDVDGSVARIAPANAATLPSSTSFKYMTFIRENWIAEPPVACTTLDGSNFFKGDGRTFNVNSSAFRTRLLVTVDWVNSGNVSFSRAVGQTQAHRLVGGTYNLVSSATAPTTSMNVATVSKSSSISKFQMRQDVVNPLCNPLVTAGIYFDYTVNVARTGSYTVTGTALRVPNHEFYIKDSDQTVWTKIFARTGSDFGCLGNPNASQAICRNPDPYSGLR